MSALNCYIRLQKPTYNDIFLFSNSRIFCHLEQMKLTDNVVTDSNTIGLTSSNSLISSSINEQIIFLIIITLNLEVNQKGISVLKSQQIAMLDC